MASKIDHILEFFDRTSEQFFSHDEFRTKLRSNKKLRIKFGVDVTAPTLHIGHAVNLWLMRYLQEMGHKVVFLIGDFTTRIGDPTGRSDMRPILSRADIDKNVDAYIEQVKGVLRFDDPELLEIRRNSEWYDKMSVQELMDLLMQVTHARLVSRDMFQMRMAEGKEIYMHELLYPVLQGWDSVMVQSDLTIIGSDQLFNEMMGRFFQEKQKKKPQTIITTKITPGIDGKAKQSKSLGNYIGLAHSPRDQFGRVMSIPDSLIDTYLRVYTDIPLSEIDRMEDLIAVNPREAKMRLAYAIVGRYHGHDVAAAERSWFENTFSKGKVPDDIPVINVIDPHISAIELCALAQPAKSKSDLRRLIKQGAVELNGEKIAKADTRMTVKTNDILKIGKRSWYRIEVVRLHEFETEHLWMKPLKVEEIDLLQKYIPAWDMVKYMNKLPGAKKDALNLTREVLKRVIGQPEPKNEYLWKIIQKKDDGQIIGVAHLLNDGKGAAYENIWIDPELHDQGLMAEALTAINEYAFQGLHIDSVLFKSAFAHAAAPLELEQLRQRFLQMDATARNRDIPEGTWGFTKEGWERMKDQLWELSPNINTMMTADSRQIKKRGTSRYAREQKQQEERAIRKLQEQKDPTLAMTPMSAQAAEFQAAGRQKKAPETTFPAAPAANKPRDPRFIDPDAPRPKPKG